MRYTKLKEEYKQAIKKDVQLCAKIAQAMDLSLVSILYRMLPADDERLTLPRVQKIIAEHLTLGKKVEIIEEVEI